MKSLSVMRRRANSDSGALSMTRTMPDQPGCASSETSSLNNHRLKPVGLSQGVEVRIRVG